MQSSKEIMAFSNVPFCTVDRHRLVKAKDEGAMSMRRGCVTGSSQFRAHLVSSNYQVFLGM